LLKLCRKSKEGMIFVLSPSIGKARTPSAPIARQTVSNPSVLRFLILKSGSTPKTNLTP
jgi:hypothetical protein